MTKKMLLIAVLSCMLFVGCEATTRGQTIPLTTTTASTANSLVRKAQDPFNLTEYQTLAEAYAEAGENVSLPASGTVKGLVLAVDFSDHPSGSGLITKTDLELAFNGDSGDVDYESVHSYYLASSYGNLDLTFDVYGFYRAEHSSSYYASLYDFGDPASDLALEVMAYYDGVIDFSQYDGNGDGYVDALYVIYTVPVSFNYGSDLWWAFVDYCIYTDEFDGTELYYFSFLGTEFFSYVNGSSRTAIHETGHLLGLDDYYDYDDSDSVNSGGLGGADMMDDTVGDMNPFSKLLLGWISPTVVTGSGTFVLPPFESSGECLLLIPAWNDTIFDEYLLISYYTPTGLNAEDRWDLFPLSGVIIYHVDARIGQGFDYDAAFWTIFNYNNTDTSHKLIKIIEADMDNDIEKKGTAEGSDLFQTGDVFGSSIYPNYNWYQWVRNPMDITVAIGAFGESGVTLTITFPPDE